jgi:hypothetical protein
LPKKYLGVPFQKEAEISILTNEHLHLGRPAVCPCDHGYSYLPRIIERIKRDHFRKYVLKWACKLDGQDWYRNSMPAVERNRDL